MFSKGDNMSYRKIRESIKQKINDDNYENMIMTSLYQLFDYPEEIYRPDVFDAILHIDGKAALIATDTAEYTPVMIDFAGGTLLPDGTLSGAICHDFAGHEWTFSDWINNPDVFVFFNTPTRTPDLWVQKFANMLTDTDTSITANTIFSRLKPVPIAKDQQTKNKIDAVLNDLLTGKISTILTDYSISDILGTNAETIETMTLTDVKNEQYIQYLSHLHNTLTSRLFFIMGLGSPDNGKQSQITTAELNRNDRASLLMPRAWYAGRKHGFDEIERKTGKRLTFDYGDLLRNENAESNMINTLHAQQEQDADTETETETDGGSNENGV